MTHTEISEVSHIPIATWYRIVKKPEIITVSQLIKLCNGLKVPARRFFYEGKTVLVGQREDYVAADYKPCDYDGKSMAAILGRDSQVSNREAARAVGMHWTRITQMLCGDIRLPLEKFMKFCEAFDYDIFQFIIDTNREDDTLTAAAARRSASRKTTEELAQMHQEMAELRSEVASLKQTIEALTARLARFDAEPVAHKTHATAYDASEVSLPIAAEYDGDD